MVPDLCHFANRSKMGSVPVAGNFSGLKEPHGITIHYSADRNIDRVIKALSNKGLGYHFLIGNDGKIFQLTKLTNRVWHAGKAKWQGLSPNYEHIAISIISWGALSWDRLTWTGKQIEKKRTAIRPAINDVSVPWDIATLKQEKSLMKLLDWFVLKGIDPESICGHDECCIPWGRKIDPGGVLSEPVYRIRRLLADLSEVWNTQKYIFVRYMILESNVRPFPFANLTKSMSKFDKKVKK